MPGLTHEHQLSEYFPLVLAVAVVEDCKNREKARPRRAGALLAEAVSAELSYEKTQASGMSHLSLPM